MSDAGQDISTDEARFALGREVAGIVLTLDLIRRRMAQKSIPPSESADEFLQGLDLAWLGGKRLAEELKTRQAQLYVVVGDDDSDLEARRVSPT